MHDSQDAISVRIVALFVLGALMGAATRSLARAARRFASERTSDTIDGFVNDMQRSGVPPNVSRPLYAEMSRALEVHGIYNFPARADDGLREVYGIILPDTYNDFHDTDLRDIVNGVARRSGRDVIMAGEELDAQLAKLRTVRDVGQWAMTMSTPSLGTMP